MPRSLGLTTWTVLHALAAGRRYGFDVCEVTGLASGTVYPALATLERRDLVRSRWEDDAVAREEGRPRRRYYTVTARGLEELDSALARIRELGLAASLPATAEEGP